VLETTVVCYGDSSNPTGVPVVLNFLKFISCSEIKNCLEILVIWQECPLVVP